MKMLFMGAGLITLALGLSMVPLNTAAASEVRSRLTQNVQAQSVTISGNVITSKPVIGAKVIVKDSTGVTIGTATTNKYGAFTVTGIGTAPFFARAATSNGRFLFGYSGTSVIEITSLVNDILNIWYETNGQLLKDVFAGLSVNSLLPNYSDIEATLHVILEPSSAHVGIDENDITDAALPAALESMIEKTTLSASGTEIKTRLVDGFHEEIKLSAAKRGGADVDLIATLKSTNPKGAPPLSKSAVSTEKPIMIIHALQSDVRSGVKTSVAANTKNDAWMSDLSNTLKDKRIVDTPLPGTHDSGTSGISTLASVSKTQTKTIGEQLDDGIRYFDLRVTENAHYDCADSSVFWLHHGELDSYRLSTAIQQIKAFVSNSAHSKEIIILDFQDIVNKYSDARNSGVLFEYVQHELAPYLMDKRNLAYALRTQTGASNNLTFGTIWDFNNRSSQKGQIILLAQSGWVDTAPAGCNGRGGMISYFWLDRSSYLSSYYGERDDAEDLKKDFEGQLSLVSATSQQRPNLFSDYTTRTTTTGSGAGLNVLQIVPRPSNAWYASAATSSWTDLLQYGNYVNKAFNQSSDSCPQGWLAKRAWMASNQPNGFGGPWNMPNIIIVDNYSGGSYWTNVLWNGTHWYKTQNVGYVDFIKNMILKSNGSSEPVTKFEDDMCLGQWLG